MKIALIKKQTLVFSAHSINLINHAEGFLNLGHKVLILDIEEFISDRSIIKKKAVHSFYGLDNDIDFKYFKGRFSLFYLRKLKLIRGFLNLIQNFTKLFDFLDPEIRISNYCIKKKFDLVYCRNSYRAAYNNIYHKIPTIVESHDFYLSPELIRLTKLSKSEHFKGIITISKYLKQNFINYGFPEDKIIILEDAVNLDKFEKITESKIRLRKKLNLLLNKKIILYSGTLNENRGINCVLEAAKLINDSQFAFYFLGGLNKTIKNWKKFLKNNDIKANIQFLGYKPYRIVPYYLKSADLLLALYSSNVPTLKWMSPLKIFEYMASKTPFIATNIGRINEIIDNNECLFTNPDDPVDLSEKIITLLNDHKVQKIIVENSFRKAKLHTYKKRCENIIKFSIKN